jgi:hypothetical protein
MHHESTLNFRLKKFYQKLIEPSKTEVRLPHLISKATEPKHELVIVAIAKDEGQSIAEWIAFHLAVGASRFLIYDNQSQDNTAEVLKPFSSTGVVEVIPWPHFVTGMHTQALAYAHALSHLGSQTRWMAFIDIDEFLFDPEGGQVKDRLSEYHDIAALCVYRHHYGTSGHKEPPTGLVIENFSQRFEPLRGPRRLRELMCPKAIVQPSLVGGSNDAHRPILAERGLWGHDELRRPVYRNNAKFCAEKLCINHYYTKDEQTFGKRLARKMTAANKQSHASWYKYNFDFIEQGVVTDTTIAPWIAPTQRILTQYGFSSA